MTLDERITEKIKKFEDLKKQILDLNRQIGSLQEQGQAIHSQALEVRGALEALSAMKLEQDEALKNSETAKLILPEGVKPVVEEPKAETPAAEAPKAETPAAPALEVK